MQRHHPYACNTALYSRYPYPSMYSHGTATAVNLGYAVPDAKSFPSGGIAADIYGPYYRRKQGSAAIPAPTPSIQSNSAANFNDASIASTPKG